MSPGDWRRRVLGGVRKDVEIEPVEDLTHCLALGLVGDVAGFGGRLLRDRPDEWTDVHVLPGPPEAVQQGASWRADLVWLRVRSNFTPRSAAVLRVVKAAAAEGLRAHGWMPLDLAGSRSTGWLDAELASWSRIGNNGPHRRRLESLGDLEAANRLLSRVDADNLDQGLRLASAFALGCVCFNLPEADLKSRALDQAVRLLDRQGPGALDVAAAVLDNLRPSFELVALGVVPSPGEGPLPALAAHPHWRVHGQAVELLGLLPGRRSPEAVAALTALATPGLGDVSDDRAIGVERAIEALSAATPTDEVIDLVERLFDDAPRAGVRQAAGGTLVALLGPQARDVWVRLLSSRVAGDLDQGERLLARHGSDEDVPLAIEAAHRLLRRRPPERTYQPPRGSDLLGFLVAYRGRVEVDALFFEVRSRWPRLPEDLRDWLQVHHPWIGPPPA